MAQPEIIPLRCPSCGGGMANPSRDVPFGAEFRCDHCGAISVIIIDQALVPLGALQKLGEKVCGTCGRIALREARFCQEGHSLVRKCTNSDCLREFPVDHQRCDFCGRLHAQPMRTLPDEILLTGEVRNLKERWGDQPCSHSRIAREYYEDVPTGDLACMTCGETFPIEHSE